MKTLPARIRQKDKPQQNWPLISGIAAIAIVTALSLWLYQKRIDGLVANEATQLRSEARAVSRLVAHAINSQLRQLALFAQRSSSAITELANQPDSGDLRKSLLDDLRRQVPGALHLTIADGAGNTVSTSGASAADTCRGELGTYGSGAGDTGPPISGVYATPDGDHVDLVTDYRTPDGRTALLCMGATPTFLSALLAESELGGRRFLLARNDAGRRIEITSQRADTSPRGAFSTADQKSWPVAIPIPGTPWQLLAATSGNVLRPGFTRIRDQTAIVLAAFLLFAAIALVAGLRRDARLTQQIRDRETLLGAVIDTMVDGVITIDDKGNIIGVNPAAESLFSRNREEMLGRNVKVLMPEPFASQHDQYLRNYLATGRGSIIGIGREVSGLRRDGSTFPMALSVGEWRQDEQRFFVGIVRDISTLVAAREKIEQQTRALTESNRDLEQFAFVASHDLQEPLRKISSFGQLLELEYADEIQGDGRSYMRFMVDASRRMSRLIEGLLEFSRINSGGRPFEPVDLRAVVDDILEDLSMQIVESHAAIRLEGHARISADKIQIRQLLQNLIGNAIKFRRADKNPHVTIDIKTLAVPAGAAEIVVADKGIGIDPKFHATIFEPFRRLHSRDEYPGTGLGLSLCRKIVDRHGGTIDVASDPGHGSRFTIVLGSRHDD